MKLQKFVFYSFPHLICYSLKLCEYVGNFGLCREIRFDFAEKELRPREVRYMYYKELNLDSQISFIHLFLILKLFLHFLSTLCQMNAVLIEESKNTQLRLRIYHRKSAKLEISQNCMVWVWFKKILAKWFVILSDYAMPMPISKVKSLQILQLSIESLYHDFEYCNLSSLQPPPLSE